MNHFAMLAPKMMDYYANSITVEHVTLWIIALWIIALWIIALCSMPCQQPPQPAGNNDEHNFLRLTLSSGEKVTVETPHNCSISVSVTAN
ncbi:hypothetical protein V491_07398, partial [Pseudogymnoascus sp. VKM F-3775]